MMGGKTLVIRDGGLRIQILATAADRIGGTVSEGKISLAVCLRWSEIWVRDIYDNFNIGQA